MKWFNRSRAANDWGEAIAPELRELPTPPPSPDLWKRIAATRAAGGRVILPDGGPTRQRPAALWLAGAALVAGIALLIPVTRRANRVPAAPGADALQIVSDLFSANIAYGEGKALAPSLPPLDLSHADRLRPGRFYYVKTWRHAGKKTDTVMSTVRVSRTTEGKTAAWLLVAQDSGVRQGKPTLQRDTLVMASGDLRLIRHTEVVEPYLRYDRIIIRQQFRGDSLLGHMNAFGADATARGRPIARGLLPQWAPYVDDGAASVIFAAADLRAGWTASASMIGWAVRDGDVFFPLELRVTGAEQVTVPAGVFDCWRMSIRMTGVEVIMWVRKTDGIGVKVREGRAGLIRENILTREER